MKKISALLLTLIMTVGMTCMSVSADDEVNVFVSVADGSGSLVVADEAVAVSDIDADGAITINDALYAAHEKFYEGGAEAGFGSYIGDYGLSLSKLWGEENGGSYGYYVNNASAWSLADPVSEGDHVYAFVYTDLVSWSDSYSWFDATKADIAEGSELPLVLSCMGYDAEWNTVVAPAEGAVIYVNGEATDVVTDAEGKAVVKFDKAGTYVISAKSETATLVPPVCVVTVNAAAAAEELPKTGAAPAVVYLLAGMMMVAAGYAVAESGRKRENEI